MCMWLIQIFVFIVIRLIKKYMLYYYSWNSAFSSFKILKCLMLGKMKSLMKKILNIVNF